MATSMPSMPSTPTADQYIQMLQAAPDLSAAWDATQQYFTFSPYQSPQDTAAAIAASNAPSASNFAMYIWLAVFAGVILLVVRKL